MSEGHYKGVKKGKKSSDQKKKRPRSDGDSDSNR